MNYSCEEIAVGFDNAVTLLCYGVPLSFLLGALTMALASLAAWQPPKD